MLRQIRPGIVFLALAIAAGAQQKPALKHREKATTTGSLPAAPAAGTPLPSEDTVNAFLQQMFAYEPEVTWKVASIKPSAAEGLAEVDVLVSSPHGQQGSILYVTEDGQHAVIGNIIPFGARPFDPAWNALKKGLSGPARGPANAPVTLVEFADLQCPHCKEAIPVLDRLMSEESNVRLVFQNFPLTGHDWAAKGAAYADCIGTTNNDAFWKFIHDVYEAQADITAANADEKLTALATQAGAKGSETAACAAEPATTTRVQQSVALGREVEVNSTPTVFINGRKIESVTTLPDDVFKKLVEFAARDVEDRQAGAK